MPEEISLTAITAEKPSGYPEFQAPPGFVPPEGIEPGKSFPFVGELQVKEDGRLCLVSIEGAEYPEEDEDYEEETEVEVEEEVAPMESVDARSFGDRLSTLPMA